MKFFYKKTIIVVIGCCLLFGLNNSVFAQKDTTFWFAAPDIANSEGETPVLLKFLSYATPATITVTQPANVAFVPIIVNLGANSIDSVDLTPFLADIESPAGNVISDNGLKIQSTANITAYYELNANSNREVFSLKGRQGLGTNFYTPFQKFWNTGGSTPTSFSSIEVVATQNNTTVLITPKTDITGHVANSSFSIVLQEGETYSARDMTQTFGASLSGSIVSSDRPIAVTVFDGALLNSGCNSTMGDQITPTDYIGNDYIIYKGSSTNEKVFILSTQNSTSLTISDGGTTSTLINWGETYTYDLTDSITYIESSKPIYVWHASGNGCNISGAQVPNVSCAGTYSTAFSRSRTDSLSLLLFVRSGFEGDFTLNGNASLIPASSFYNVPGTNGDYKAAKIFLPTSSVPVNSYNEVVNSGDVFGLGVLNGNNSLGSAYAYFSEFVSYPFIDAGIDDTVCANTLVDLNGVIGGGDVTGLWSTSGFGTFTYDTDSLINQYVVNELDTAIDPIRIILSTTGSCTPLKDTIELYISPSPHVNANTDQTVCANNSSVQLNGSVSGGATTGQWSSAGSGTFTPNDTTLNAVYTPSSADSLNGGVDLILVSTNYGQCNESQDTMHIFITPAPIVDAGADTVYVCENNNQVGLSGVVSGATTTGKWTTSGNGLFTPNNITLSATYEPSPGDVLNGSTTLYLESTNEGDCNIVIDSLLILYTPKPSVDAGPTLLVSCTNNSPVQLNGVISGPTTTGFWSGGNGTYSVDSTDLNAVYSPTAAEVSSGSVVLTLTSSNNQTCSSESDIVQIDFVAPPFANFNFTNECLGEDIDFTDFSLPGFGNINGWSWDMDDLTTYSNQNVNHTYSTAGDYFVELIVTTDVGCSDTVIKLVSVYEPPVADFSYTSDCSTNNIILSFDDESVSSDALNYWFYDFGTLGSSNTENPTQIFTVTGNYNITHIVGTVNGCYDTIIKTVVIPPKPVAGFYYNTSNGLNIGATFNFIDTSSYSVDYLWDFDDGNSSTNQNPSNTFFSNGVYYVTQVVTSAFGCTDSISIPITINTVTEEIDLLIPNAISPNGDGKNDVWKLDFLSFVNSTITVDIFNRWGQVIFHSEGYNTPWDGTHNGSLVPEGTYFYVINLNNDSENPIYKGNILVMQKGK